MSNYGKRNFIEIDQRDPAKLDKDFYEKFIVMLNELNENEGIEMVPYSMRRSLAEQCRLYRQSRTTEQVKQAIMKLESRGMHYTAYVLNEVGPQVGQAGKHVTWTITNSFHLYGMAVDSFWKVNRRARWSLQPDSITGKNGYKEMRKYAKKHGLAHLRGDYPHIQAFPGNYREAMGMTYSELDMHLYELNARDRK